MLLLLAACSSSTTKDKPGDNKPSDGAPVATPPVDAAAPAPVAADTAALQGKCREGDRDACDAIAEFWAEREILRPERAAQAKVDAEVLDRGCEQHKLSSACMGLALMTKYGTAGAADGDKSKQYWAKVAALGDLNGWRGKPPDTAGRAALAQAEKECEAGRARACVQAGWAAFGPVQRDKNVADALKWYRRACELGSGQGCRWAGHFAYTYADLGKTGDARALLERGCDALGGPGACAELGLWLEQAGKDPAGALTRYKTSCTEGNRVGCFQAARAMVATDPEGAKKLMEEACKAGEEGACAK